jgi:hypothetical protein
MSLTFDTLRAANTARLPEFKNKHGDAAHTASDGSDWSPAQWFQAMVGEVGELARERVLFERGAITPVLYACRAANEEADVATYLDLFSKRALDEVRTNHPSASPAQLLMQLMVYVGQYANQRKKFDRGDSLPAEFVPLARESLEAAQLALNELKYELCEPLQRRNHPADEVVRVHKHGIDLGDAVVTKFNEVSERVGSGVYMDDEGWHYRTKVSA